jgi:hypothetical protein
MADIGLAGFSMFFMQSESFLSYQRHLEQGHGRSNCQTLFGMERIPTDHHIRSMLDQVSPDQLRPCFDPMLEELQRRDGEDALQVNWIGVPLTDAAGKTTNDGAYVTRFPGIQNTVAEIAACARARWKIENESFNVLKNNGYPLEHNFGHGKQYLARTFVAMNLLAFAFHTVCDCLETLWQQARTAIAAHVRFFRHMSTLSASLLFPDWTSLMNILISGKAPPR